MVVMHAVAGMFVRINVNVRMQMHRTGVGVSVRVNDQAFLLR